MLLVIFAMLLLMGVISFFTSYTMLGGAVQIVLIGALGALGVKRICAVSSRIRRYQVD
jgi:hypothetical protein